MNTVQRYIETEKIALNTYIPIDRYLKIDLQNMKRTFENTIKICFIN